MGRAEDAYALMRGLGIGITNNDLNKIPVAEANFIGEDSDHDGLSDRIESSFGTNISSADSDNDSYSDKLEILSGYNPLGSGRQTIDLNFAGKHVGKIFLQVEAHGEAWYINPDNKKRYYLGIPTDAYALMRSLGLGITNDNLNLIPISSLSIPLPASSSAINPEPLPTQPILETPEPLPTSPVVVIPEPLPIEPVVVIPEPLPMPPIIVNPEPVQTTPIIINKVPAVIPDPLPEPPRLADIHIDLSSLPVKEISSCQTITESGQYILTNDITSDDVNCFKIDNVQDVSLDCQGHEIDYKNPAFLTIVTVNKVSNFKIQSCNFSQSFIIKDSHNGILQENTFGSTVEFGMLDNYNSSYLQFENNTFHTVYQQISGDHVKVANNNFFPTLLNNAGSCVVSYSGDANNNEFISNEIDGRSDGIYKSWQENVGFDDGICLGNSTENRIEGNTIRNNWDAGIEGLGNVSNSLIKDNLLINNILLGIGSWYWSSWWNNTVEGNIVDNSDKLLHFVRLYGLRSIDDKMYFLNNQFINNKLINPRDNPYHTSTMFFPKELNAYADIVLSQDPNELPITPEKVFVGNNLIMNNDFTKRIYAPLLGPASIFIDGGGNICNTTNIIDPYADGYPINCL